MLLPFRFLAVTGLLVLGTAPSMAQTPAIAPGHVGSQTCSSCHESEGQAWKDSHHAWAWTQPDETTILGDFDDAVFEHKGVTTHFTRHDGSFSIETEGSDGALHTFQVAGVVGVAPLQQYLIATQAGRLQALDIAWDIEDKRWYHLYPDQNLPPGDGLHWTGPYKNWNARCAECHATGYLKNYDARARRYQSRQAEIGVGCEACHGPGEAHVAWAETPGSYDAARWQDLTEKGFTVGFSSGKSEAEIQQCAGCHARRESLFDSNPVPGTAFHDAYRLALLREGLYHADGSIQEEVYVYGSFLQSKMYTRGVRCSDCHDPHAAQLKAEGNAVCTQCHSPAGNPSFPTLRKAPYDNPSHHFHETGTEGGKCKSCHMIERVYMGIDGRRDHSFRIPRPDLSAGTGAPNACTDCHKDKSDGWAAAQVAARFPNSSNRGARYATPFAAARQGIGSPATTGSLLEIALSTNNAGIVRATALDLLRRYATSEIADRVAGLLRDRDPLVRTAAIPLQRAAPPTTRVRRIGPLLEDDRRAVRIEAVRAILDILAARAPSTLDLSARAAIGEYQRSLAAKADFPEAQLAIAGTALVFRNFRVADRAFSEAVKMDPQLVNAWAMIARLRAAQGDIEGATNALLEGLAVNPNDENLAKILKNFRGSGRPN